MVKSWVKVANHEDRIVVKICPCNQARLLVGDSRAT